MMEGSKERQKNRLLSPFLPLLSLHPLKGGRGGRLRLCRPLTRIVRSHTQCFVDTSESPSSIFLPLNSLWCRPRLHICETTVCLLPSVKQVCEMKSGPAATLLSVQCSLLQRCVACHSEPLCERESKAFLHFAQIEIVKPPCRLQYRTFTPFKCVFRLLGAATAGPTGPT